MCTAAVCYTLYSMSRAQFLLSEQKVNIAHRLSLELN